MPFTVIIPSRLASTRLPRKALADIHGKPMIAHVVTQSLKSGATRVIVATDDSSIANAAQVAGAESVLTRHDHESGTSRLSEAVDLLNIPDDEIIVNVQGDEPFIEPELIAQVARDLDASLHHAADMATIATPIYSRGEAVDPNVVKVVRDGRGNALYFSRAMIPWDREAGGFGGEGGAGGSVLLRHIGLYAYRARFLRVYPTLQATRLEEIEKLEQLRVIYHGRTIHVSVVEGVVSVGVDTEEDLQRVRGMKVQHIV